MLQKPYLETDSIIYACFSGQAFLYTVISLWPATLYIFRVFLTKCYLSGTSFRRIFWVICTPLLPRMNMTMPAQPSIAYHTRSLPCNLLNRYSLWDIHEVLASQIWRISFVDGQITQGFANYHFIIYGAFWYLEQTPNSWYSNYPTSLFFCIFALCICLQGWHQFPWMIHETVISFLSKMIYKKTLFEMHLHFPQGWIYLLNNQLSYNMVHVDRVLWKALHWHPHL